jgi:DNA-directed RNA polymerase subunit F
MSAVLVLMISAIPALAVSPRPMHGRTFAFMGQHRGAAPSSTEHPGNPAPGSPPPAPTLNFHLNGPGPHRGDWLRKYSGMSPNQQEQQLQHDPSFRSLPQEKQEQLMNRLREFNSRPPEQKQQILNRMETFEHMTPQQQQQARSLFNRYRTMPEDQRNKVSQAYRRLRGMPPAARNDLLNSDEFKNQFSDDQRDLLRGMTDLYLPQH